MFDRHSVRRRGVSSVLAMMFLVIFGSLTAAMAVVAQGNLRTADSHMKVNRAMSAAETGLVFATRRLGQESSRFVVTKGVIDDVYGSDLWLGDYPSDGSVVVLPPEGYTADEPSGIVEAIMNAHLADTHWIEVDSGDYALPEIDTYGTLRVKPIALDADTNGTPSESGPYFRLTYTLAVNPSLEKSYVLVTSEGVDNEISRVLQMLFPIEKKIEYAVISPSRIMIGKNVRVEGPLGSRFGLVDGELDTDNGDPLIMQSDFYYLDNALDNALDVLYEKVAAYDADGDARLRLYHPEESQGIAEAPGTLIDYDGNEYVDDFDLFMAQFDTSPADVQVVYDEFLAAAAGLGSLTEEFTADLQLARLMDDYNPDRDGDGVVTPADTSLGYHDGVLDIRDTYAKVHGRLSFAIARNDWEAAHGESYQTVVQGPISAGIDEPPVTFEASEEELRELTTDMFNSSQSWFESQVPGGSADFQNQVDNNEASGGTYTPPGPGTWESIPYGAQGAYDYYQRPVYENMTFQDVRIPMGTNGVFKNCKFVGVTFIETEPACTHENWNYAGALEKVEDPDNPGEWIYELKYPGVTAELGGAPVDDTKPYSNNIRFDDCTFIGSISGTKPNEYTHWRNKVQLTGRTRFYIDVNDPDLQDQPDASEIEDYILAMSPEQIEELSKSSILMPGWSADMGNFTNEQAADPEDTPKVKLKGTIVAGILDVRGTADVNGTLLMTFRPTEDEGPLFYGGLTDAFNTTIGYFGPSDGDGEGTDDVAAFGFGEITLRYDEETKLPDGIPWPITVVPDPESYTEGGGL